MSGRVKLSEVIEAIDLPGREWRSFLNRDTGQIVTLTEDGTVIAEDEDFDRDALDDAAAADERPDRILRRREAFENRPTATTRRGTAATT